MNKSDLIRAMAAESGLTQAECGKALGGFISAVTNALKEGDKVALLGFGSFSVAERAARTGINPATKATIEIPAKNVVKFKAGAELAEAVEK
jgi:DNA-binding protein HU-beta